jgi:hypothetical protein
MKNKVFIFASCGRKRGESISLSFEDLWPIELSCCVDRDAQSAPPLVAFSFDARCQSRVFTIIDPVYDRSFLSAPVSFHNLGFGLIQKE